MSKPLRVVLLSALLLPLAGCDKIPDKIPGLGPSQSALQQQADARAIGGACRYAQRGIEDCYTLNSKYDKALVFAGWKEMDQYMRDNKLEGQPSVLPRPAPDARSSSRRQNGDNGNTDGNGGGGNNNNQDGNSNN